MATDDWTAPTTRATNDVITAAIWNSDLVNDLTALFNGLVGDASADALMLHRHKSGTLAAMPAVGNAGRRYYATDLGAEFLDDGTDWTIQGVNKRKAQYFFEEFATDSDTSRGLGWATDISGTGAVVDQAGHNKSVIVLATDASLNAFVGILNKGFGDHSYRIIAAGVPAIYSARMKTDAATQGYWYCGLTNTRFSNGITETADGVYFRRVDGAGAGTWESVTRAGGVETANGAVVTGDTAYHDFEIRILSTTSIGFYIDGVLRNTHATNIPSNPLLLSFNVVAKSAAARGLLPDFVEFTAKRE